MVCGSHRTRAFAWPLAFYHRLGAARGHEGRAHFRCCALPARVAALVGHGPTCTVLRIHIPHCAALPTGSFAAPRPTKGPVRTILRPMEALADGQVIGGSARCCLFHVHLSLHWSMWYSVMVIEHAGKFQGWSYSAHVWSGGEAAGDLFHGPSAGGTQASLVALARIGKERPVFAALG
jgi:hypothetical protein